MLITFLGSGSAFVNHKENYQSNILMNINGETLLYDAGTTINDALNDIDISVDKIDNIFISHLHADHAGGIEYLAFKTYFGQFPFGIKKPTLIGNIKILKDGWNHVWSGGLKTIHGKNNKLSDYFNIKKLKHQLSFIIQGIPFYPVQAKHVDNELAFGLEFKDNNCWVFISGDSKAPITDKELVVLKYYDLIFHDCEFAEYSNSVHAQFHELCKLPDEIKSKMWLYHYSLNGKHIWEYDKLAEQNGFAGVVRRGQTFDTKHYSKS